MILFFICKITAVNYTIRALSPNLIAIIPNKSLTWSGGANNSGL